MGVPIGKGLAIVGACLGAAGAVIGGSLGIARIGGHCVEAIARQPEASGSMFAPMILTAAMIEGGMLFALVICLLGVF
ncbi:MAG: ATP synthase F0 subunit C [Alphaproteobacteria bacterium]